jgi:ankyrin repeat protein
MKLAVLNGHTEIAEFLLENGAVPVSLNDRDAFFRCVSCRGRASGSGAAGGELKAARAAWGGSRELLQLAAERDRRPAIRLMAELGFDLNERRRTTALHNAAMAGHLEMVRLLIELGADPRIRDTEFNAHPIGWAKLQWKDRSGRVSETIRGVITADFRWSAKCGLHGNSWESTIPSLRRRGGRDLRKMLRSIL